MTDRLAGAAKSAKKSISRKTHGSNKGRPPMVLGERLELIVPAVSCQIPYDPGVKFLA
jgi:hypothetical protein